MADARKRAVVIGFEYYGRYLARLINEHSSEWSLVYRGASYLEKLAAIADLRHARALVCFGGPGPDAVLAEAARSNRVPVVVIWAGTDVITVARDPGLLEVIEQDGYINVSDGPWLVDELRELGVDASYVPVTAVHVPPHPAPLPPKFRVISYLPEPRQAFYGEKAVFAAARSLPDIRFTVVGKGAPNPIAPHNVEFRGYVDDMAALIDDSVALLRMPEHDGKSMLVLETLARARHVVWTYPFPGVLQARTTTDAIAHLRQLQDAHGRGELAPNATGLEFVRDNFAPEQLARGFENVLESAAAQKRVDKTGAGRRVVLTGYNLFSARVAEAVRGSTLDWEPRVLRASRRLERVVSLMHLAAADVWYTIGSPIPDRLLHLAAGILGKSRVVHWVGSDVMVLSESASTLRWCRGKGVTHLAEVDWMIDELAAYGIKAHLAPLPPQVHPPACVPPMPETFTVLLYVPRLRGEFYGKREYERLFRAFAGKPVRFLVVGGGQIQAPDDADVVQLGWRSDLPSIYEQTSVLLRFTKHDGLSLMVLEALSYGRHVVWSKDFPFARRATDYRECERALTAMLERHLAGELRPQADASAYVGKTYDRSQCIDRIAAYWDASINRAPVALDALEAAR